MFESLMRLGALMTMKTEKDLPMVPASSLEEFRHLVRKARPLKRAMNSIRAAFDALRASEPGPAIYLATQAAVLAGRGSSANVRLAARIAKAAYKIAHEAMEMAERKVGGAVQGGDMLVGFGVAPDWEKILAEEAEKAKAEYVSRFEPVPEWSRLVSSARWNAQEAASVLARVSRAEIGAEEGIRQAEDLQKKAMEGYAIAKGVVTRLKQAGERSTHMDLAERWLEDTRMQISAFPYYLSQTKSEVDRRRRWWG